MSCWKVHFVGNSKQFSNLQTVFHVTDCVILCLPPLADSFSQLPAGNQPQYGFLISSVIITIKHF